MMKRDVQQGVQQDVQQVVRAQYRAALKNDVTEACLLYTSDAADEL